MTLFVELSLLVVVATLVSLVMKLLKQPLVVGYIAAGILVGPYAFNIIQSYEEMELFSKIGVAILLFIVGLTLNPDVMREVGRTSVVTGIGQVLFTSLVGFLIVRALGFETLTAFYIAVALTFSSTIIILKLLSDRGDTGKLYGKISIGFLLVQDVIASILILIITILGAAAITAPAIFSGAVASEISVLLIKGALAVILLYLVSRYVLPGLSKFVAGYQEVLFIFSLAWGLGVTLAASPFAYEIASRMKPLRDFFIMLFFILLGSQVVFGQISMLFVPAAVLSIFVLVGNPLIMLILMNLLGYRTRTAFMAGLTVAQISEFSLILVALGYSFGHLSREVVSLVTLVGIITISGSTYLILYADQIYPRLKPILKLLTVRKSHAPEPLLGDNQADIVIFGYDRVGHDFVEAAREISQKYLVVDFNPRSIAWLAESKIPYRYGDAEDVEFLEETGVAKAQLVVSTIPDLKTNILLVNYYHSHNPTGIIMTISHSVENTKELYEAGASYVVMPHYLGASHAASLISKHRFDRGAFENEKARHLENLIKYEK
ncbi:MAG: Sodium/hydrogen exchanger [Parcubacteria group bacterium GW2011_GWC1_43_30]|nr:MAG: Sodium/hydrogen exchanger [Parcubacteria group bacterium GW2011_GWC1_43_30]